MGNTSVFLTLCQHRVNGHQVSTVGDMFDQLIPLNTLMEPCRRVSPSGTCWHQGHPKKMLFPVDRSGELKITDSFFFFKPSIFFLFFSSFFGGIISILKKKLYY